MQRHTEKVAAVALLAGVTLTVGLYVSPTPPKATESNSPQSSSVRSDAEALPELAGVAEPTVATPASDHVAQKPAARQTAADSDGADASGPAPLHRVPQLMDLSHPPTAETVRALRNRGVQPLSKVAERTLAVRAPLGFDIAEVPGIEALRDFTPQEKLSPLTRQEVGALADDETYLALVEFADDVAGDLAVAMAEIDNVTVIPRDVLQENVLLTRGTRESLLALATREDVVYVLRAPRHFADEGEAVAYLGGPYSLGDTTALFELINEGWDGPGLGTANLRYYFGRMTPDIPEATVKSELLRAMTTWSQYVQVTWAELAWPNRVRSVDFAFMDPSDPYYEFDGPSGTLAWAYSPTPDTSEPWAGDMEFDDAELWEVGNPGSGFDVFSIALHELGHSLGVGHTDVYPAVMYPSISSSTVYTALYNDDIAAIQSIYASVAPPSGAVLAWESLADHGASGTVALPLTDGSVEPRLPGMQTLRVTFDTEIDLSTVNSAALAITGQIGGAISTAGSLASLTPDGLTLTFTLPTPLTDADNYTLAVGSGVLTTGGQSVEGDSVEITAGALAGDVDGSGTVGRGDIAAARTQGGAVTTAADARSDIDTGGIVNGSDMLAIRRRMGNALP